MSVLSDIGIYCYVTIRHDHIDSRDLIKARDEAEKLIEQDDDAIAELAEEGVTEPVAGDPDLAHELLTEDERDDLKAIIELVDDLEGCCADWHYGATFIHEDHWQEYAEDYAREVCDMRNTYQWPFNCIDWSEAADELATDYTQVDIDGDTYYVR